MLADKAFCALVFLALSSAQLSSAAPLNPRIPPSVSHAEPSSQALGAGRTSPPADLPSDSKAPISAHVRSAFGAWQAQHLINAERSFRQARRVFDEAAQPVRQRALEAAAPPQHPASYPEGMQEAVLNVAALSIPAHASHQVSGLLIHGAEEESKAIRLMSLTYPRWQEEAARKPLPNKQPAPSTEVLAIAHHVRQSIALRRKSRQADRLCGPKGQLCTQAVKAVQACFSDASQTEAPANQMEEAQKQWNKYLDKAVTKHFGSHFHFLKACAHDYALITEHRVCHHPTYKPWNCRPGPNL